MYYGGEEIKDGRLGYNSGSSIIYKAFSTKIDREIWIEGSDVIDEPLGRRYRVPSTDKDLQIHQREGLVEGDGTKRRNRNRWIE